MGSKTKIKWTNKTWNPILGCSRVSEGCRNCYAEQIAGRFGRTKEGKKPTVYDGLTRITNGRPVWTGMIKETRTLLAPLSWRKPARIFVNSMSDLFHENVSDEQRDRIFAVMALCPEHTFQVLTKRPERMLEYLNGFGLKLKQGGDALREALIGKAAMAMAWAEPKVQKRIHDFPVFAWSGLPLPNVWLGVSCEDQETADARIPLLLQCDAAVRFVSLEPLLGPIDLGYSLHDGVVHEQGETRHIRGIDWVIVGGESGHRGRPMDPAWAQSLRSQCTESGTPFFFKQWGRWFPMLGHQDAVKVARVKQVLRDGVVMGRATAHDHHSHRPMLDGLEWQEFPEVRNA